MTEGGLSSAASLWKWLLNVATLVHGLCVFTYYVPYCLPINRFSKLVTSACRESPTATLTDRTWCRHCTFAVHPAQTLKWQHTVPASLSIVYSKLKKVKVAHTQLPRVGFRSWSRFLAVSLQVTSVINPVVGCHYFLPGPQLTSQPLRGLLPIWLLGEQRHNGCEQFA